jgi:hypothetical protein
VKCSCGDFGRCLRSQKGLPSLYDALKNMNTCSILGKTYGLVIVLSDLLGDESSLMLVVHSETSVHVDLVDERCDKDQKGHQPFDCANIIRKDATRSTSDVQSR